jgi:hypothetical protein
MAHGGKIQGVIYLTTTPKGSAHMSANASVHGRALRAGAILIACALALAACKKGDGDAQAKAKEGDKGPEAIPVEVMAASKRRSPPATPAPRRSKPAASRR